MSQPNPAHIMQIGTGFMASRTLLAAVDFGLFTTLAGGPKTAAELAEAHGIHPRGLFDFLDALVSLRLLDRVGDGAAGLYANTPDTALFLDKASPAYLGGILEMCNDRLYHFWGNLGEALRTGEPQNESKDGGGDLFELLYADEAKLEGFLSAMQGVQLGAFNALVTRIDLGKYTSFCDVGGANGTLSAIVAKRYPSLACTSFDLPAVCPIARRSLDAQDLQRVEVVAGNFFEDDLPAADVICMGNVLHDWDEAQKRMLIGKARAALSEDGIFVAIENVIDDARRTNAFGLLMSLNMLIELPGGFDYTGAQFDGWCRDAGFARTEVIPLAGPTSAAVAYVSD